MKTGIVRRLDRRGVIAAERIRKIQHVRIKLTQRPPGTLEIKENVVIIPAEQYRVTGGIDPVQKMGMRLHIKHVLNLPELRDTHKLQRFRIPLLRMTFDPRRDNKRRRVEAVLLEDRISVAIHRLEAIIKGNHHRACRQIHLVTQIPFQLIHRQGGITLVTQPGHLVTESAHRSGGGGMAKTAIFFITQNMVISQ